MAGTAEQHNNAQDNPNRPNGIGMLTHKTGVKDIASMDQFYDYIMQRISLAVRSLTTF